MLIDCSAHMGSPQESRGLTECVSRRSQADVLMQSSVSVTEQLLKVNVKRVWTLEERKKEEEKPHRRPLFAHLCAHPDDEPWRPELHRNSSTFVLQDEFHSHYPQFKVGANITLFFMTGWWWHLLLFAVCWTAGMDTRIWGGTARSRMSGSWDW